MLNDKNLAKKKKALALPKSLHDKVLWSHITGDEILVTYDGECVSGLVLKGFSYYGTDTSIIDVALEQLAQSVLRADENVTLQWVNLRLPVEVKPLRLESRSDFADNVQNSHNDYLLKTNFYQASTVLLLSLNPFTGFEKNKVRTGLDDISPWHPKNWLKMAAQAQTPERYADKIAETCERLKACRATLQAVCKRFSPMILTRLGELNWYNLLSLPINGLETIEPKHQPRSDLLTQLTRCDMVFNDEQGIIEFQDTQTNVRRYGAVLSVLGINKQFLSADCLSELQSLNFPYYRLQTYEPWLKRRSQKKLTRHLQDLLVTGDESERGQQAIQDAKSEVDENGLLLGEYSESIFIVAPTQEALDARCRRLLAIYQDDDIVIHRETDSLLTLFLSLIPGNRNRARRKVRGVTNQNVADLVCPMQDYQGHQGSHLGEAISIFPTIHRAPYYFNWHLKGHAVTNVQFGATLIVGAVGSGKNVFAMKGLCDTQRFGGKMLIIDYRRANRVFVAANEGEYITVDLSGKVGFAPLHYEDAVDVLSIMCLNANETELPSKIANALAKGVKDCVTTEKDMAERSLEKLATKYLPVDFERHDQLSQFLPGHQYGALFNAKIDSLSFDKFLTGIDLTYLVDSEKPVPFSVRGAVLQHITNRMNAAKKQLAGGLFTMLMDEFWNYLKDPYWQTRIETIFASWRKDNGYPILLQQDVARISQSPVGSTMKTNLSTAIAFHNTNAQPSDYAMLGFTEEETMTITKLKQYSDYAVLIKQKDMPSEIINVDCHHLKEYLHGLSANDYLAGACDEMIEKHGEAYADWYPDYLLHLKNAQEGDG